MYENKQHPVLLACILQHSRSIPTVSLLKKEVTPQWTTVRISQLSAMPTKQTQLVTKSPTKLKARAPVSHQHNRQKSISCGLVRLDSTYIGRYTSLEGSLQEGTAQVFQQQKLYQDSKKDGLTSRSATEDFPQEDGLTSLLQWQYASPSSSRIEEDQTRPQGIVTHQSDNTPMPLTTCHLHKDQRFSFISG